MPLWLKDYYVLVLHRLSIRETSIIPDNSLKILEIIEDGSVPRESEPYK